MEPEKNTQLWWDRFKKLLDEESDWPTYYVFKFIVPSTQLESIEGLLEGHELQKRHSSNGKYVSVTAKIWMETSEEVIQQYNLVSTVEGIILL